MGPDNETEIETTVEQTPEESRAELMKSVNEAIDHADAPAEPAAPAEPEKPEDAPPPDPAKPAEPAKPDEAPKRPSDEFGELPATESKKTRERFEQLREKYDTAHKERDTLTAERDQWKAQATEWVQAVESTKATPEQFGQVMEYLKNVNSADPASLESAYTMMQNELAVLAKALGKEAPGVDPLEAHPDLQEAVENDDIDRKHALEMAALRQRQRLDSVTQERAQAQSKSQAEYTGAIESLKQLGAQLQASDPLFSGKRQYLEFIARTVVQSGIPPAQWAAKVAEQYKAIPAPAAPPTIPAAAAASPDPIRPGATVVASGMQPQPKSAREAMDFALARGGG